MRRILTSLVLVAKRLKLLVFVLLIGVVIVVIVLTLQANNKNTEDEQIQSRLTFQTTINPGKDTRESVENKLGTSDGLIETKDSGPVLTYKTKEGLGNWSSQVYLDKNNTVYLTIERAPLTNPLMKKELTKDLGTEDLVLYGPGSPIFNLYVYTSRGQAFLASTNPDTVSEVWTFVPSTTSVFKDTIASKLGYTDKPYDFAGTD